MNARTGEQPDFVPNIDLDRFVETPPGGDLNSLPSRKNEDVVVNSYGLKLLTLCKENEVYIVNGRLDEGKCTFHSTYRKDLSRAQLIIL